ncbi:MAG: sugar phosphate isomerase/epimerase family protein [Nitrososphaerota archaeon]|jgi:sugar phosphate isomerase/epimerase
MNWKYSITLSSFKNIEPLKTTLERMTMLGFDAVEMYGEPDSVDVGSLMDLFHSYNIAISGITGMWGYASKESSGRKLVTRNKSIFFQTQDYIKKCIALCEKLDGNLFNVCLFSDDSLVQVDKNHARLSESLKRELMSTTIDPLREISLFAKDRGVDLLIEPLNRYSTPVCTTSADAMYVVKSIAQENVGLLLDTFHMNIEEDSIEYSIKNSKGLLKHIHLADNNRKMPGFAHINFREIVKALRELEFDRYISFEPFVPDAYYENDIRSGIELIRSL